MKIEYMTNKFFVASLDFGTSGCDDVCFNAKEIANSMSKFFQATKKAKNKGYIIIKKYVVTNQNIVEDLTRNEFIQMYFDNVEWVMNGIKEIEKITMPIL